MSTSQTPRFKPAGKHVTIIPPFAPVSTFIVYNRTGLSAEAAVVQMRHSVTVLSYFSSFKTFVQLCNTVFQWFYSPRFKYFPYCTVIYVYT